MPAPSVGARVVVPLGVALVTGIVVEIDAARRRRPTARASSRSSSVLDAEPFIPPDVVELARWTAEYYAAGAGETITAVLPPKARGGRADAHKTTRVASR